MALRIQVLGLTGAWLDGRPVDLGPAGQRAVLGLLVLAGGRPVTRSALIEAIWADEPPESAVNILQTRVKHLRRALEPGRPARRASRLIPRAGDGYRIDAPSGCVDLFEFRRLARLDRLDEALGCWKGDPLADVPVLSGHPALIALAEERYGVLVRHAEALLADGRAERAVALLAEAAAARPLDEAGQARLIRAYQAAGRRAEAFATYHAVRELLVEELGVDPGPELAAAHEALLREETPKPGGPTAPRVPRTPVPAELPPDLGGFVGREAELAQLDHLALADRDGPDTALRIIVLSGTPGVGKTTLAVRWAQRRRDRFADGQLYVDLRGYDPEQPMAPGDAPAGFLRSLGLPPEAIPVTLGERVARLRSMLAGRRMLLLLDNAASVDQVRPLLPGTGTCVVLVTSRDSLTGLVVGHDAKRLELDLLPLPDAMVLFTRLLGARVGVEAQAAAALAVQCARLPLALRIVAELAAMRGTAPLATLVDELSDQHRRLDLLVTGSDPRTDVGAVFSWSYGHLPPPVARIFRLLGLHPGPDIDSYALAALCGEDPATARRSADVLARAHLLGRADGDRYALHDLLRAYAAQLVAEDDEKSRAEALAGLLGYYRGAAQTAIDTLYPAERRRLLDSARHGTPAPDLHTAALSLSWLDAERANLVATAVHAARHGRPEHTTALTIILLRYLESAGHYDEATTLHTHALQAAVQVRDRRQEAHLETNFAVILAQQGRYPEAVQRLERAASLAAVIADPVAQARAVGNLGHVYQRQGRFPEAAERLAEAIALCRQAGDSTGEARGLGNLGQVYLRQGRDDQAVAPLRAAVDICRRIEDATGEAYALISISHIASRGGAYERAEQLARAALELCRRGNEPAGEGYALDGLGLARLRRDDPAGALALIRQALEIFRRLGERAGEANACNSLGEALTAAGDHAAARAQYTAALMLATEIGDEHQAARARRGLTPHPTVPGPAHTRL
ncbi:XRE family transcriptional regulator [Actinoplanes ianthinogenes]|uniref:XRE family transcriptional regulator n=1 Tax=Actinoplanes ianthinogenes TaxID=122358 RepID=A0ABM7M3T1_9ACTN|nr:tetratricopeptide repeat protein [Actinoplanes ianthinogenes]BCJ46261.1 XRE family transcriptional regulator [Actinoplanes ianthinogenes]GGR27446.1 XRE family transcriptional regulator [Actinoplanes ianthinogenes]